MWLVTTAAVQCVRLAHAGHCGDAARSGPALAALRLQQQHGLRGQPVQAAAMTAHQPHACSTAEPLAAAALRTLSLLVVLKAKLPALLLAGPSSTRAAAALLLLRMAPSPPPPLLLLRAGHTTLPTCCRCCCSSSGGACSKTLQFPHAAAADNGRPRPLPSRLHALAGCCSDGRVPAAPATLGRVAPSLLPPACGAALLLLPLSPGSRAALGAASRPTLRSDSRAARGGGGAASTLLLAAADAGRCWLHAAAAAPSSRLPALPPLGMRACCAAAATSGAGGHPTCYMRGQVGGKLAWLRTASVRCLAAAIEWHFQRLFGLDWGAQRVGPCNRSKAVNNAASTIPCNIPACPNPQATRLLRLQPQNDRRLIALSDGGKAMPTLTTISAACSNSKAARQALSAEQHAAH